MGTDGHLLMSKELEQRRDLVSLLDPLHQTHAFARVTHAFDTATTISPSALR
jgi:hypothetical protein